MTVLITGATGLVGSKLVEACLSKGFIVHYLSTSKSKIKKEDNLKGFYWDPKSKEIDVTAFEGVQTIINLAGAPIAKRWTSDYKKDIVDSRVDSLNLLKATIESHNLSIDHLISASAIGYYPDSQSTYYTETYEANEDQFVIKVVKQWEAAADRFKTLDIPVAKIRIGVVLSNQGGALPKLVKPIKNFVGSALGHGKQWQSWIHIDDLAQIFMYVLEHQLNGIYNAVAPNPVMQSTLTKAIADTTNRPLLLPNVPAFALRLMLGEMSYIVLTGQRVSSKKIEDKGFNFKYHHVKPALESLL